MAAGFFEGFIEQRVVAGDGVELRRDSWRRSCPS